MCGTVRKALPAAHKDLRYVSKETEAAKVNAIDERIHQLKKEKAQKDVVMAEVENLKAAMAAYEEAVGEPFPAPATRHSSKKKRPQQSPKAPVWEEQQDGQGGDSSWLQLSASAADKVEAAFDAGCAEVQISVQLGGSSRRRTVFLSDRDAMSSMDMHDGALRAVRRTPAAPTPAASDTVSAAFRSNSGAPDMDQNL